MKKYKVLITTYPFGLSGSKPLDLLKESGHEIYNNPLGRRLRPNEVSEIIKKFDIVIAGTEPYPIDVLENSKIKAIFRVGIGLDNIPLNYCKNNDITVGYTPDAPSQAVAELTVANIINLSRNILQSNISVRKGEWKRYLGYLIEEITIGIVGLGRIGSKVAHLLQPFNPNILVAEIQDRTEIIQKYNLKLVDKETLFRNSNIVSLHIPNNKNNYKYINKDILNLMKKGSYIINTSRGQIIDEHELYNFLKEGHIAGAALDVFCNEPYKGKLTELENIIFTAHMGASAQKSRYLMELNAVEDFINFANNKPLVNNALIQENLKQSKF